MILILSYLLAVGAGVLIAYFITRADELRSMRLSQIVLLPLALALCVSGGFFFVAGMALLAFLVAPNIAFYLGVGLVSFLDHYDWTPTEEEIALRPIRLLIETDNYRQALAELDELLTKHKPTYEAILVKAKLLNHIGRVDEARSALLNLIALSQSPAQQLSIMEMLAFLEENHPEPPKSPAPGTRRIEIHHDLILFQMSGDAAPLHKEIPPGAYVVEEIIHRNRLWLKLAREDFGNDAMCWEAILAIHRPVVAPSKKGFFWRIARMHQVITIAIMGKPHRQRKVESQQLFNEAKKFIHREDWKNALPLLQEASACDPDRYEIAYRWVLAVRHTSNDDATAAVVSQVLQQSQWSKSEQDMLKQVPRSLVK